jgi:2-oxoglutarate ferredoxin oxidoreductase subunit alpha
MARVCQKTVEIARSQGIKAGLIRPITLFPFPKKIIAEYETKIKGYLTVEMNAGQMVEDVRLSTTGKTPVEFYGRMGGIVPSPEEVLNALKSKFL